MYDEGWGVKQDYVEAYKWFDLAARDASMRDKAISNRDRVSAKMTPKQIAGAQRLASQWKSNFDR